MINFLQNMLMVIFGAGASYDSCHSFRPNTAAGSPWSRPPLAKDLFLNVLEYRRISQRYPRCQTLFPYLDHGEDIEGTLEGLRDEAELDPERRRQLMAIQYYLSGVIAESEAHWWDRTSAYQTTGRFWTR